MFIRTALVMLCFLSYLPLGQTAEEPVKRQFGKKITVYKSPSCGCCAEWVQHLRRNGFSALKPLRRRCCTHSAQHPQLGDL